MTAEKKFHLELQEMFERRITALKSIMEIPCANRKKDRFSREYIGDRLDSLCAQATQKFAKILFEEEVMKETNIDKIYTIKGRGIQQKKALFRSWVNQYFSKSPLMIYVFFSRDRRCLYVGKTGRGGKRPLSQLDKHWIHQARYILIFEVRTKSHLPKLECLATHLYMPREFRKFPSRHKWTKACPMCRKHQVIMREVKGIFRLK